MNIEIEDPLNLLLELTYLNGSIADKVSEFPKMENINKLMSDLVEIVKGDKKE